MNFCLDDGATLLYGSGTGKGRNLPPTRNASPAPTEVLNQGSISLDDRVPLITTIQSLQPPQLYSPGPHPKPIEQVSSKRWIPITIGSLVVLLIGALIVLGFVLSQRNQDKPPETNTNANVRPSPSVSATPEDEVWNETNNAASLTGVNLTYYPGTTPDQCKADCEKNQQCKGFTYIRAGAYNPKDSAMCYMASAVTGVSPHSCCISGVKR